VKSIKSPSWISSLLGLEPIAAPPWAISVGPDSLALARVESRGEGGLRVEDLRVVGLGADTFQIGPLGGPPKTGSDFAERCRQLLGDHPPTAVSLVLPDEWVRLVFTETTELPSQPRARNDILAWKLKRLVPFRVEELRFEAVETPAINGQEEPQRMLLAFGVEALLAQLESHLGSCGVHVGRIRNRTLGMLSAAPSLAEHELALAILVGPRSWSLLATLRGEPVLTRVRPLPAAGEEPENLIRELRLSRAWLADALPRRQLGRVALACELDEHRGWAHVLEQVFESRVDRLEVAVAEGLPTLPYAELVALAGSAAEVFP
jgi:hypothetical protein